MRENKFQRELIQKLKREFPGCMILKNDANYMQGIPDLSIFYKNRWAVLECKKSMSEPHQPNQDTYIDRMNAMSYAAFIYPENIEDVIVDLRKIFS